MGRHKVSVSKTSSYKIRVTISLLALLGIVGVSTVSAFSDTATTTVDISAGTINLNVDTASGFTKTAILDLGVTKWAPGVTSANKVFTVQNAGTIPLTFSLTTGNQTGGLGDRLNSVLKVSGNQVYSGLLKSAAFSNITIPAGGQVILDITVNWVSSGDDNSWAGKTDTVVLTFNATS